MKAYRPQKILVPYDGHKKTAASVEYAAAFAKLLGAKLYVLHVVLDEDLETAKDELAVSIEEAKEHCRERYRKMLGTLEAVRQTGLESRTSVCFSRTIAGGVADFCREKDVDLVVTRKATSVGGTKEPLPDTLISREALRCLIYKHPIKDDPGRMTLLVPVDNRKGNVACICHGIGLAAAFGCKVIFYYATESVKQLTKETCPRDVLDNLALAEELAKREGVAHETRLETAPFVAGVLESAARAEADLILMREFAQQRLIGSYSFSKDVLAGARDDLMFGSAAVKVDEKSEHNFLYCTQTADCRECRDCVREHEAAA